MERINVFRLNADSDEMKIDHEELVLRRESAALTKERTDVNSRYGKQMLRSLFGEAKLYVFLVVVLLLAGVFLFLSLTSKEGFQPAFALPSGIVFLAVLFALILRRKRGKGEDEDAKLKEIDEEYGRLCAISEKELRIPSDAKKLEIMTYYYHEKGEDEEVVNDDMRLFEENGAICFYWGGAVYGFSRDSVTALVKVEKELSFPEWWKDEPYDGEKYANCGIKKHEDDGYMESYSANCYYSLRFTKDGIDFEITIPPYELETANSVLKMQPITE